MTRLPAHGLTTIAIFILAVVSSSVHAVVVTSTTDPFEGSNVTATAGISSNADRIFLGGAPEDDFSTTAFFDDNGVGSTGFIEFTTPLDVALTGVTLFAGEDGVSNGFRRAMSNFRLLADLDLNSTFETELTNQVINLDYGTQPGNVATAQNELDLTFNFPSVTGSSFRAEFVQGTSIGAFDGVRVFELDALGTTVPEANALLTLGIGAMGLLLVARGRVARRE